MSQSELYRRAFWAYWALLAVVATSAMALGPASALSAFELVIVSVYAVGLVAAQLASLSPQFALAGVRVATGLSVGIVTLLLAFASPTLAPMAAYYAIAVAIAAAVLGRRATWIVLGIASTGAIVLPIAREQQVTAALLGTALIHVSVYWLVAFFCARQGAAAAADAAAKAHDPQTGLMDYRTFVRQGVAAHAKAVSEGSGYAVLMIDIDNLKSINDSYGHSAGNDVVVMTADVVRRMTRGIDLAGRFSGDKFVALLWSLTPDEARTVAQRIRNVVHARTLEATGTLVRVRANVGLAHFPGAGATFEQVVSRAETDMYEDRKGREPPAKKPVFRRRSGKTG